MASNFAINTRQQEGDELPLIMVKGTAIKTYIRIHGRSKKTVEISCAPWKLQQGAQVVDRRCTYVVRELALAPGYYLVWLETNPDFDASPIQDYLVFSFIRCKRGLSCEMVPVGAEQKLKWPIYYDPGQRLVLVDRDLLGEGPTTLHQNVPPPDAKNRPDNCCYTITNPVARGNWGTWEESLVTKAEVAERRRARNRR